MNECVREVNMVCLYDFTLSTNSGCKCWVAWKPKHRLHKTWQINEVSLFSCGFKQPASKFFLSQSWNKFARSSCMRITLYSLGISTMKSQSKANMKYFSTSRTSARGIYTLSMRHCVECLGMIFCRQRCFRYLQLRSVMVNLWCSWRICRYRIQHIYLFPRAQKCRNWGIWLAVNLKF